MKGILLQVFLGLGRSVVDESLQRVGVKKEVL